MLVPEPESVQLAGLKVTPEAELNVTVPVGEVLPLDAVSETVIVNVLD